LEVNFLIFVKALTTTNVGRPIKGSKDADFCLVSLLKRTKKLPREGWSPGSGNLRQTSLNLYSHLRRHSSNNL